MRPPTTRRGIGFSLVIPPVGADLKVGPYEGGVYPNLFPDSARQPAFTYSFDILDEMYVASYGLPGGPVFVSRGFLQSAESQQAVAEAIARSISHIALRHGTTQAASADAFQPGAITGADIGAVIAGPQRPILAQGAGFGVASYFLIYREEFEKQAAQLVSRLLRRRR